MEDGRGKHRMSSGIADWGREQAATLERGLDVRCHVLMKRNVRTITPEASIEEAARLMRDHHVGFLPVCDQGGQVVGTVTDRDITIRATAAGRAPTRCRVDDVMTREVVACRPDDDLSTAERLMSEHQKSRICIVDEGRFIQGVISLSDIAKRESYERATQIMRQVTSREAL